MVSATSLPPFEDVLADTNEPTKSMLAQYDFLDIGSSKGGSIEFAMNKLGGKRGLGIDIRGGNVEQVRRRGYDCLHGDIAEMTFPANSVRFAVLNHVLEHMALYAVHKTVRCATEVATDFVYIRGPYFDADAFLKSHGLKFYWSDWHGHTCHVTTSLIRAVLVGLDLKEFVILGRTRVDNSQDGSIHPLASPIDQHEYVPGTHPPKPTIRFNPPLYREIVCVVRLRDIPNWPDILKLHQDCDVIGGTLRP